MICNQVVSYVVIRFIMEQRNIVKKSIVRKCFLLNGHDAAAYFACVQDGACEAVDYEVESTSSSSEEEDEDQQEIVKKQQAVYEKDRVSL